MHPMSWINDKLNNYLSLIQDIGKEESKIIYIINKIDIISKAWLDKLKTTFLEDNPCYVSCKNETTLEEIINRINIKVENICHKGLDENSFINERHSTYLSKICESIDLSLSSMDEDLCISAYHLRYCVRCISQITGTITNEDILDEIFKTFCIGK